MRKICNNCGVEKPLDEYHNDKRLISGKMGKCKKCVSISNKARYVSHERCRLKTIDGYAGSMLNKAKQRCFNKPYSCSITKEWIASKLEAGVCPLTGIQFDLSRSYGPFVPSLDRIDSTKGYTEDNSQVVVWMYNSAKNKHSHEDVIYFSKALLKKEGNRV